MAWEPSQRDLCRCPSLPRPGRGTFYHRRIMIDTIYNESCLEGLKKLPDGCVNTCVTSPPYFGLRDYGVEGQIGLEPSPQDFVNALVSVFREVKRVLRDDGTLWLNLGDTYSADRWSAGNGQPMNGNRDTHRSIAPKKNSGLPDKNLIGIPWRVAFALQADGWYLRQDIIWAKRSCMPEAVKDRCTKSHEYIFLMSKQPKYYFDSVAIKEKAVCPAGTKGAKGSAERYGQPGVSSRPPEYKIYDGLRNKRDVWFVAPRPCKDAHFATFPPELIRPCILAGAPSGGLVLDPFMGAGTTAMVSKQEGRNYVGFELNPAYVEIANKRIAEAVAKKEAATTCEQQPLFFEGGMK